MAAPSAIRGSSSSEGAANHYPGSEQPSAYPPIRLSARSMPALKRVLVANRGEIALRIIRACHEEGLEAIAVYSAADRGAAHVRAAARATAIGPAAPSQSYLSIDRLISAARESGAEAVHPGY